MNLEDYSLAKINIEIHEINIYKINLRKFLLAESKKYYEYYYSVGERIASVYEKQIQKNKYIPIG